MHKAPLDDSLAYTIIIESCPGIGAKEGAALRAELLDAWYAQATVTNMWVFGRNWLEDRTLEAPQQPAASAPPATTRERAHHDRTV